MTYTEMKTALAVIDTCDCLSVTEEDMRIIISVVGNIIKHIREMGMVTNEISFQYAVLKEATWSDGYFCVAAKKMCSLLYPIVELCERLFNDCKEV